MHAQIQVSDFFKNIFLSEALDEHIQLLQMTNLRCDLTVIVVMTSGYD